MSTLAGMGALASVYGTGRGLSSAAGALLISAVMIGNTGSKLVIGFLCDLIGPKRSYLIVMAVSAAGCLLLLVSPASSSALLMAAGIMLGTSYSFGGVGLSAICKEAYGADRFAQVFSIANAFVFIGTALSTWAYGAIFDVFGNFVLPLSWCVGAMAVSALLINVFYRR